MKTYFESYEQYKRQGNSIKTTTITAKQLLPALIAHMERMDRQFTLHINGQLPMPIDSLIKEAFDQCHLEQPFYTQHCEKRSYKYRQLTKNRVKVEFTMRYRMARQEEKWIVNEIQAIIKKRIHPDMSALQKVFIVHDYIARTYSYERHTDGSPFAVYTFMNEKHGVCMAYALLFEKMMEALEIPCYYVIGKAAGEGTEGHAWNMVQIDDHWYHVDVTWDDIGSIPGKEVRYRYFLVADEKMRLDHEWNENHYPMCTSKKFEAIHRLYDGCLVNTSLYYAHPRNGHLYEMNFADDPFQTKQKLIVKIQFCFYINGFLYFRNDSHNGYLYQLALDADELTQLSAEQVIRIYETDTTLEVLYADQTTESIQKSISADIVSEDSLSFETAENCLEVLLNTFGDSWVATVDQQDDCMPIVFKSADGIELYVDEHYKQLTVDLYINRGLHIQMTSNRKNVEFKQPAQLKLPITLIPGSEKQLSKQNALEYFADDEFIYIQLYKSVTIQLKK
ncbi:transglutaminase domain-containing protein [Solibacillus isronensis]|uniref:transglutaminase domain-containing protein n=1 Tax=Solibacillus isronensis TaxID=412383 RepID=UPI0009A821AA|nr:transglutaminase domain-containing protein [Solibacillus isronensis]